MLIHFSIANVAAQPVALGLALHETRATNKRADTCMITTPEDLYRYSAKGLVLAPALSTCRSAVFV